MVRENLSTVSGPGLAMHKINCQKQNITNLKAFSTSSSQRFALTIDFGWGISGIGLVAATAILYHKKTDFFE